MYVWCSVFGGNKPHWVSGAVAGTFSLFNSRGGRPAAAGEGRGETWEETAAAGEYRVPSVLN